MTRRWHWDFEGEHGDKPRGEPAPAPAADRGSSRATQVRRRRRAPLISLLALAVILWAARPRSSAGTHTPTSTAKVLSPKPSPNTVAQDNAAVASVLAYTPFVKEGSARVRDVAITFDDGPGPYTPAVLSVLEANHVQATFFEIGKMLRYFGPSTEREIRDGDVIGDHTQTHPMMAQLPAREQREQLFEPLARIEILGGPRPTLFRPPYGSFNATTFRELRSLHLLMVLWSTDTDDYEQPGVAAIVQKALEGAHPGAIILMHDAGGTRTETVKRSRSSSATSGRAG